MVSKPTGRSRGRPPGREMTALVRAFMPPEELAALDSARGPMTRSEAIRSAIRDWTRKMARKVR